MHKFCMVDCVKVIYNFSIGKVICISFLCCINYIYNFCFSRKFFF
jgi:hypothetical protein